MMLLVDIGNSRIKLGWLDRSNGTRELEPLAIAHDQLQTMRTWLSILPRTPTAAIGSNVASTVLAAQVQRVLGLSVDWICSCACAGDVRNGYRDPAQLGSDRWLALIGLAACATRNASTPLMLVNYGTATTIDTLAPQADDGTRRFVGGLILPGVNLMRTALARHTAKLPWAQGLTAAFPDNTDQAIVSGVCAAQAGAVVQQWRRAAVCFDHAPALYVSGGDWSLVSHTVQEAMQQAYADLALTPGPVRVVQSPILDGLAHLGTIQAKAA